MELEAGEGEDKSWDEMTSDSWSCCHCSGSEESAGEGECKTWDEMTSGTQSYSHCSSGATPSSEQQPLFWATTIQPTKQPKTTLTSVTGKLRSKTIILIQYSGLFRYQRENTNEKSLKAGISWISNMQYPRQIISQKMFHPKFSIWSTMTSIVLGSRYVSTLHFLF